MKDKKIGNILAWILVVVGLLGFAIMTVRTMSTKEVPTQPGSFGYGGRFELVDMWDADSGRHCQVYRDTVTNVLYLCIRDGNMGGLTVLVNEDGSPMMYDGFDNSEDLVAIDEEGLG